MDRPTVLPPEQFKPFEKHCVNIATYSQNDCSSVMIVTEIFSKYNNFILSNLVLTYCYVQNTIGIGCSKMVILALSIISYSRMYPFIYMYMILYSTVVKSIYLAKKSFSIKLDPIRWFNEQKHAAKNLLILFY